MKLIYKGKYKGVKDLPVREVKGRVKFREPETMTKLAIIANILAIIITGLTVFLFAVRLRTYRGFVNYKSVVVGCLAVMLTFFPHELLHAVCFKEDVELYTNFKQGLIFVTGTEDFTKAGFVFMSLLPNIVFGFLPFIVFMIWPTFAFAGIFGALAIGMGRGDYMNVYNCLTQVPKGGLVYMSGMSSWWYLPERKE